MPDAGDAVVSAWLFWGDSERTSTAGTTLLTTVRQTSSTLGTTTISTASSTLSHKTSKLHTISYAVTTLPDTSTAKTESTINVSIPTASSTLSHKTTKLLTISHAQTTLPDTSTAKTKSTINVSITTESAVTTRSLENATEQPLFTTSSGSGDDFLPAVVVSVVLVIIITIALIFVFNREDIRKKWNLLLERTSLDNYKTQTFHKEAEAVSTECGYVNLPLDFTNTVATNDANLEYHYINCVPEEETTHITDNNNRAITDEKYRQQGLHALPVLGNIYAHLNNSKSSQTETEYAHTNTSAIGNQAREAQEYASAACYHTTKTSQSKQSNPKNGMNTMNESPLNEQDSLYSHASTNKEKNDRKIENTDTYSHIQVVSTSSGNETQTLKEIEKVYKKTNFHSDTENEGEYDEPQHEYFVLEPMSGQRKEQENKSLDMGTRKK